MEEIRGCAGYLPGESVKHSPLSTVSCVLHCLERDIQVSGRFVYLTPEYCSLTGVGLKFMALTYPHDPSVVTCSGLALTHPLSSPKMTLKRSPVRLMACTV